MMQELQFHLDNFEGPLDLLLELISRHKMDLHDIPILTLIDQYLEVLRNAGSDLDGRTEFVEMASRLVEMKSWMLLPHNETGEQLKKELTGELIEYELCRRAAEELRQKNEAVFHAVREPQALDAPAPYERRLEIRRLSEVLARMGSRRAVKRMPAKERFVRLFNTPSVPVARRMLYLLERLRGAVSVPLRALFSKEYTGDENIASFLALLELMKDGRVRLNRRGEAALLQDRADDKDGGCP